MSGRGIQPQNRPAGDGTIQVTTRHFGTVPVRPETVITFPDGLVGMSELNRFALLEGSGPLQWLQSLDDPDATFVVMPMDELHAGAIAPATGDLRRIGADGDLSALLALVLITVPPEAPQEATANLMAPLLIHPEHRIGIQAVLSEELPLRHPLTQPFHAPQPVTAG